MLWNNQRGMTILESLVSTAILAIAMLVIAHFTVNAVALLGEQKKKFVKLSVRHWVNKGLSCSETLSNLPSSCIVNSRIRIRSSTGILIDNDPSTFTQVAGYQLRATCISCPSCDSGREILIERRKLVNNNSTIASDWESVYSDVPFPCRYELWDHHNP